MYMYRCTYSWSRCPARPRGRRRSSKAWVHTGATIRSTWALPLRCVSRTSSTTTGRCSSTFSWHGRQPPRARKIHPEDPNPNAKTTIYIYI